MLAQESKKSKSKYLALTEDLRQGIANGLYPVGSKLPSVLALCKRHGVSSATAHRSIRRLAGEQLVACHSGPRGTIVLRAEGPMRSFQKSTLACLLRPFTPERNSWDNFGLEIIQGIQDESTARGFGLLIYNVREERAVERAVQAARERCVAGLIADQQTPVALVNRLADLRVPMVMFNRMQDVENLSIVTPDYVRLGAETARLLWDRGYERFAYGPEDPRGEPWSEGAAPQLDRRRGYLEGLAQHGVSEREVRRIVYPDPPEEMTPRPEQLGLPRRRPADWRRLGIFLRSDLHSVPLMRALSQTDLVPGRDVGLIGADNLDINRLSPLPFSTWDVEPYVMGRQTVVELLDRIENPNAPRTVVKLFPRFVDRGTA